MELVSLFKSQPVVMLLVLSVAKPNSSCFNMKKKIHLKEVQHILGHHLQEQELLFEH